MTGYAQYLPQTAYSSGVPRNWNSISVISWKPSFALGSLNREAKPMNASLGKMLRSSGLSWKLISTEPAGSLIAAKQPSLDQTHRLVEGPDGIVVLGYGEGRLQPNAPHRYVQLSG